MLQTFFKNSCKNILQLTKTVLSLIYQKRINMATTFMRKTLVRAEKREFKNRMISKDMYRKNVKQWMSMSDESVCKWYSLFFK